MENRIFKVKNPTTRFFCPLCRTERAFIYKPRLEFKHFIQISMITVFLMFCFYPLMGWRSVFFFFFIWASYELGVRLLFRKEIPCPHCGFDASWYKRDVKVARKLVHEFWQSRHTGEGEAATGEEEHGTEEALQQV